MTLASAPPALAPAPVGPAARRDRGSVPPVLASYAAIHDAILRDLARLADLAGRSDLAERREALSRWWSRFELHIDHHHVREDDLVFPMLAERGAELDRVGLAADHEVLEALMVQVREGLAGTATVDLAAVTSALLAHMDDHLAREEAEVFPAIERLFTKEEYAVVEEEMRKDMGLRDLAFAAPWILDEAHPHLEAVIREEVPGVLLLLNRLVWQRRYRRVAAPVLAAAAVRSSTGAVPAPIPTDVEGLVEVAGAFVTTEYASLTRAGAPITTPVTPYRGQGTLDVSTGLTYPVKAERARRDPRVTLAFSDPTGSGWVDAPTLVVKGLATVRDADLVTTSRRYVAESQARFPDAYERIPDFVSRRMAWYWARMWVEVTPVEVLCWPGGDLSQPPLVWRNPDAVAPPSDPAPAGKGAGTWSSPTEPWEDRVGDVIAELGAPVLTVVDADGWPLPVRTRAVERTATGFVVTPPAGVAVSAGPASLVFHRFAPDMEHQDNVLLVGSATPLGDGTVRFDVERSLSDISIPRSKLRAFLDLLATGRALRPRLQREAARRGQTVPTWEQVRPA